MSAAASILRAAGAVRRQWLGVHVLEALDADAVRRWSAAALESLEAHRGEIDDLNVFPVPDGDTGTNLAVTLRAGNDALNSDALDDDDGASAATALRAFAHGAVMGARGNSGVIMSQLLRGIAEAADGKPTCGAAVLRAGLARGAEQAYAAVADPVEGTILSVARAAAEAASTDGLDSFPDLAERVLLAAAEALSATPQQLPELARAGVVDAGGRGLVLVLDALDRTITGATSRLPEDVRTPRSAGVLQAARESGSGGYGFEVQYLLDAPAQAVDGLRVQLAGLGDCVAVVGTGTEVWNVHVHVNDVGAAIEAGLDAGRPRRITVVHFAEQMQIAAREASGTGTAVVAVAPGQGVAHLFEAEGVRVVDGGIGYTPSTEQVVAAVRSTGAGGVVLLPNASRVTGIAEAAAEQVRGDGIRVTVVPTRSPVQGLAAVAVHDPARRFDDDVVAMAEAAAATRFAEVTMAQHESLTSVGICQAGDVLGLIDGEVVEIGRGLVAVTFALIDRLLGVGVELMTVLVGADAPAGVGELLAGHVRDRSPLTDVSVYAGGQPGYPLIIGVE